MHETYRFNEELYLVALKADALRWQGVEAKDIAPTCNARETRLLRAMRADLRFAYAGEV